MFDAVKKFFERDAVHKYVQASFFTGGFFYDSVTLTRIDRLLDNVILLGYLLLLGLCIVIVGRIRLEKVHQPWILRYQTYYPLAIQFFLGGLFSAYVVFYIHSASWSKTWIFVVVLFGLLVANEYKKDLMHNLPALVTLFFFVTVSFVSFFLPVVFGLMSWWLFLAGALLSLVIAVGVWVLIYGWCILWRQMDWVHGVVGIGVAFVLLMVFYFQNWIPPVPLALKFGGIYHQVRREGSVYHLTYVEPPWYAFYQKSDSPFYYRTGDRVYCFASIFAPTALKIKVVQVWQHYDEKKKDWLDVGRIGYAVAGGREGGYRGYTYKQTVVPGDWRVNVETDDGRLLGCIRFQVVASQDSLTFVTMEK